MTGRFGVREVKAAIAAWPRKFMPCIPDSMRGCFHRLGTLLVLAVGDEMVPRS